MTYDVAQYMIEGKIKESFKEMHVDQLFKNLGPMGPHTVPQIVNDVLNMHKIASCLRKRRFKNGALAMNNSKLSFKLNEFGNPINYAPYITREANHMVKTSRYKISPLQIEEYMLLANQQVAARIAREFPEKSLLRNHTNPLLRKLDVFVKFCAKNLGIPVDATNAKSLGQSLEALGKTQSAQVFSALRILATRSMQLAKYFCTGNLPHEEWKHYALNVDTYTHFTSPIRRYPDIIVHRQLQAALTSQKGEILFEFNSLPGILYLVLMGF
jgi:exoribonuclease R